MLRAPCHDSEVTFLYLNLLLLFSSILELLRSFRQFILALSCSLGSEFGDLVLGRCFGKRDSDERLFRQKIFLSMRFFCIRLHNPTLQPSSRVFSALFLGGLILNSD